PLEVHIDRDALRLSSELGNVRAIPLFLWGKNWSVELNRSLEGLGGHECPQRLKVFETHDSSPLNGREARYARKRPLALPLKDQLPAGFSPGTPYPWMPSVDW